ncbi:cytochrome P450 monooxygenase pc-3 [Irpex rosettiformis]|uniref:Cytochrome P450 monooxygenase pc-3 n=1 Tax=Irpex rosettiformis TaxID=378272 RepID=A0ACB8U7B4_9APHY|nr:cytochrome P450 monooxygenase pc-3 [Irpex rosettiformis]
MVERNQHWHGPLPQALALAIKQLTIAFTPSVVTALGLIALRRRLSPEIAAKYLPGWVIALSAITSIPALLTLKIKRREWSEKRKAAAYGATLPVRRLGKQIGNIDIMGAMFETLEKGFLSEFMWDKMAELGYTYEFYVLWDRAIVTSDVNITKTVLATDFPNYVKGETFNQYMKSVLGTGVFNSDGDMWKFHRTMTRPFFTKDRISHFDLFDRHADHAIVKIKERNRSGYAVDFQDLVARFTLDSATEFLFRTCVHSLETTLPYPWNAPAQLKVRSNSPAEAFAQAFAEAQEVIATRTRIGVIWPFYELFRDKTAGPMKVVDAFLMPILETAVARHKEAKTMGVDEHSEEIADDETLLDHLVKYTDDPVVLRDEVLNIMIAGRDTTGSMLTIAVYFLSQYPEVMQRLRQEVLDRVGPTRRPTYDDVREMKYLRAVINESMRLYPAVPWNMRYNVNDTVVRTSEGSNIFIPAGTSISYSVHCMHRRTDYWGPDAEQFDPDRFIDSRVQKYLTPNPFIFLPFNAGPRICLGQQFAYNEMSFFLIKLMQNFESIDFDVDSLDPKMRPLEEWKGAYGRQGIEKMWPWSHLTLYIKGGLWVKMNEAKNGEQEV